MDTKLAISIIDRLIESISLEINYIKSDLVQEAVMQVAIHAHDHISADSLAFGTLSQKPTLDEEALEQWSELDAIILDREQRRNALKHLRYLIQDGNPDAIKILQQELGRFFGKSENYNFLLNPEQESPNEHVRPYPVS